MYKNKMILVVMILLFSIAMVGCGDKTDDVEKEKGGSSKGDTVKINVFQEDYDEISLLTDIEHMEHGKGHPFMTDTNIGYMDENYIVQHSELSTFGINWRTGEDIWEEAIRTFEHGYYTAFDDGVMYYITSDDTYFKSNLADGETHPITETEYKKHKFAYTFDYQTEKNEKGVVLRALNYDNNEVVWEKEFTGFETFQDMVEFEGHLVLQPSFELGVYILDVESGQVLYEDKKDYFEAVTKVEDDIVIAKREYSIEAINTKTWEKEQVALFDVDDYSYNYDTISHEDNLLLYNAYNGLLVTDMKNKEPLFYVVSEEDKEKYTDKHPIHKLYHNGNVYVMYEADNGKMVFSVIDIEKKEIKEQYLLNKNVNLPDSSVTLMKISEEKFVVVTRNSGVLEFEFASFE